MATLKQKLAVKEFVENHGVASRAMIKAGYKEKTAKNPKNLTDSEGFKEEAKPFIEQLERHRQKVIKRMEKEIDNAQYQHLNSALDTTTKLIQLLGGKETEIVKVSGINYILPNGDNSKTNL